jgi:hypothetical protein
VTNVQRKYPTASKPKLAPNQQEITVITTYVEPPEPVEITVIHGDMLAGMDSQETAHHKAAHAVGKRPPKTTWQSIVTVGGGRGFLVVSDATDDKFVITAAHCLPNLPPPFYSGELEERTYRNLLGPIGEEPTVWAECLFVDPIADIAVLGTPDDQALFDQAEAYENFLNGMRPLLIRAALPYEPGWMYSLDGRLFSCRTQSGGRMYLSKATKGIQGGMSGSPILARDGKAIGILCTAHGESDPSSDINDADLRESMMNPILSSHLPGWLLRELKVPAKPSRRPAAPK